MVNIADYNLIKDAGNVVPNYEPEPRNRAMYYFFDESDYVIIWAEHDNNYHYWTSRTKIDDTSINDAILCHIKGSTDGKILTKWDDYGMPDIKWHNLFNKYHRFYFLDGSFSLTAADIKADHLLIKEKCSSFVSDSKNLEYLNSALELLSERTGDPVKDYKGAIGLIEEMKALDFLTCSDNTDFRNLYSKIQGQCGSLYGEAMTIMR